MTVETLKSRVLTCFDPTELNAVPEEWGFFITSKAQVTRLGYATNLVPEVIVEAARQKVDFLLTHHDSWEFVFGLKEQCNALLRSHGISHGFFHAPLDGSPFGTSASLAAALGLRNTKKVIPYAGVFYAGRVGELEKPLSLRQFTGQLEELLEEPVRVLQNNQKPVRRVCVTAGGGNMTTQMRVAAEHGCDAYVTGEYSLYSQQYARLTQMNLLVGSHTNTEILGVKSLAERIAGSSGLPVVRISESND